MAAHAMEASQQEKAMLLEDSERRATPARPRWPRSVLVAGASAAFLAVLGLSAVLARHGQWASLPASSGKSLREQTIGEVAVATLSSEEYTEHPDKNAYAPFGAVDIDGDKGVKVDSLDECKHRCSADPDCDCITWLASKHKCWKRSACVLAGMTSPFNKGYSVFMRKGHEASTDTTVAGIDFEIHYNKDAYYPFGATDIDSASSGAFVKTQQECMQRCADDDRCDCVTYGFNKCWKRCNCDVAKMTSPYNNGYTVFKKKAGAEAACPAQCLPDDELIASNREILDGLVKYGQTETAPLWSDEFDGSDLDTTKWDPQEDTQIFNRELQQYKKDGNAVVQDGVLRITAKCENYKGQNFTSAKLHSRAVFGAGHRVEARLRMSTGKGSWPAFWLMGVGKDPWPLIGEIDILEHLGCNPDMVMGNLHYEHRHGDNPMNVYRKHHRDVESWHTYQVDWRKSGMIFYIDGEVVGMTPAQNCYLDWPYNTNKFFIILNLALGGTLGGTCLDGEQPQCGEHMDVDWVRVSRIELD